MKHRENEEYCTFAFVSCNCIREDVGFWKREEGEGEGEGGGGAVSISRRFSMLVGGFQNGGQHRANTKLYYVKENKALHINSS